MIINYKKTYTSSDSICFTNQKSFTTTESNSFIFEVNLEEQD